MQKNQIPIGKEKILITNSLKFLDFFSISEIVEPIAENVSSRIFFRIFLGFLLIIPALCTTMYHVPFYGVGVATGEEGCLL
jgi:hypothetical protein